MRLSVTLIKILIAAHLILLISCSKNSTDPDEVIRSSLSVSGDLEESYDVVAYFGLSAYSSDSIEKEYFSFLLFPQNEGTNVLAMTFLYKSGPEPPLKGSYYIGKYALGEDIPSSDFGGSFSGRNMTDFAGYMMTEGILNITESGTEKVKGNFEMSGYFVQGFESDTTRIVNISGVFSAVPIID